MGYRRTKDGSLEIVPEEAETVKMIFADYLSGMGKRDWKFVSVYADEGVSGCNTCLLYTSPSPRDTR